MNVVLVDSNEAVRSSVSSRLREQGLGVLPFRDAEFAFLFLLTRPDAFDAVVVNSDRECGLLRRLDVLGPMVVLSYSGLDLAAGAEIATALMPSPELEDRAKVAAESLGVGME